MKTTKELSEYEINANQVIESMSVTFKAIFIEHGKHFVDDQDSRDIYECVFMRKDKARDLRIRFGASINDSGFYYTKGRQKIDIDRRYLESKNLSSVIRSKDWDFMNNGKSDKIHYPTIPTAYDVLSCIQKYDVGSFENFCSEFGYDIDSRKAKKVYKAVLNEWRDVSGFFTTSELEQLQEIQ